MALVAPVRADAPVVGVQAWTSGSQTFVRVRPSALTPPVAKVPAKTPLYVWGRFNDWYRVETHDHIFGWVHKQYIKSPRLWKVKPISQFKAEKASEKSSTQTMYGTVAELKAYHARYGGAGAVKGLALKGVYLSSGKPVPAHIVRVPKTPATPQKVLVARAPQAAPRVNVAPTQPINPAPRENVQPASNAAQVLGRAPAAMAPGASSLAGAVRSWTPKAPVAPVTAPSVAVAPPSTLGQTLGQASSRIERQSSQTQTFAARIPAPQPRSITPVITAPSVQNNAASRPLAPVLPNNNVLMAPVAVAPRVQIVATPVRKSPTAEQLHIIAWQQRKRAKEQKWKWLQAKKANEWKLRLAKKANERQWRIAQAQKRAIAAKNRRLWLAKKRQNRAIYLASRKSGLRNNLGARVGLAPKKLPANVPGTTLAPFSPDELMKAREQYLQKNAPQNVRENVPLSTSPGTPFIPSGLPEARPSDAKPLADDLKGNLNVLLFGSAEQKMQAARDLSASSASGESSGHGASNSAGAPTSSSMPVPFAVPAAPRQTRVPVTNVAPMPSRGGSPRDRAAMAWRSGVANQALSYRGMPYIYGAASPARGFDCSGLIYFLLRQRGLNPPRTAAGYRTYGTAVSRGRWQTGDLLLFANTYKRGISHIGVYLKDGKFVHAASSGKGVRVDSIAKGYFASKYWGARRVK